MSNIYSNKYISLLIYNNFITTNTYSIISEILLFSKFLIISSILDFYNIFNLLIDYLVLILILYYIINYTDLDPISSSYYYYFR